MTAYQSQTRGDLFSRANLPTATPRRFSDDFAGVTDVTPFSLASYHRYDVLSEISSKISGSWLSRLCVIIDARKPGWRSLMSSKRSRAFARHPTPLHATYLRRERRLGLVSWGFGETPHHILRCNDCLHKRALEWRHESEGGLRGC